MKRVSQKVSGTGKRWSSYWKRKEETRVDDAKRSVANNSWERRWEEIRERGGGRERTGVVGFGDDDTPDNDQFERYKKKGIQKHQSEYISFDDEGGWNMDERKDPEQPPASDFPEETIPGADEDKFVETEIMKMESRVLKAVTRKEARKSLKMVTQPSKDMFTFNKQLVPPPPNITNILVPSAIKMGQDVYVNKKWKLVYQGGPNDTYLDSGPGSASEVAFFGSEGCGKSSLINALTEQKLASSGNQHSGVKTIDFYQAPDPKLWKDVWADGPTKYPASTRISKTHWGGMLVDLPGFPVDELRPYAKDAFHQCVSQYYEGTRRQLKGTFYCIDATRGLTITDQKWLKTIPELVTRVSLTTIVITKADLIPHDALCRLMNKLYVEFSKKNFRTSINLPIVPVSSLYGWGIDKLRGYITMQSELLPWWKRVEEQRSIVADLGKRTAEEKERLIEERVAMAESFKLLDSWQDRVTKSINESEYGMPEVAREAEMALVTLEKQQEKKLGMYMEGMGARYNPLIKNPYMHNTVQGGAPLGPGMAPTTLEGYVDSLQKPKKIESAIHEEKLAALQDVATEYPSDQQRYNREWVRRGLGERSDARRGVTQYTPTFATDPDITKEEWDTLSPAEVEAKVVRNEEHVIDKMRYGFDLNDIKEDITKGLGDVWDEAIMEHQSATPRKAVAEAVLEPNTSALHAPEEVASVPDTAAHETLDIEAIDVTPAPPLPAPRAWHHLSIPSTRFDPRVPYRYLGFEGFKLKSDLKLKLRIVDDTHDLAEEGEGEEGETEPVHPVPSFTDMDLDSLAKQVLAMKQQAEPDLEEQKLKDRIVQSALPEPKMEDGGEGGMDAAADAGFGLPKHEDTSVEDPKEKKKGKMSPAAKWKSFTDLLEEVPRDVLYAAQPVDSNRTVYKNEWTEPHLGVTMKMTDGLGKNNEPSLLSEMAAKGELKQKQMGPHYMGFPWMDHDQISTAVAIHEQKKAVDMSKATFRYQAKAVVKTSKLDEIGPALLRGPSDRAVERHAKELLKTDMLKKSKERKTDVVVEVLDPRTNMVRYRKMLGGRGQGPISRTPEIALGESQGLAPIREQRLNERLERLGERDKVENELGVYRFKPAKNGEFWHRRALPIQLVTHFFNMQRGLTSNVKMSSKGAVSITYSRPRKATGWANDIMKEAQRQQGPRDRTKAVILGA